MISQAVKLPDSPKISTKLTTATMAFFHTDVGVYC